MTPPAHRRLEGQVALVTGAARGIGRGIAERFLAEGARVGAVDVDAPELERLRAEHAGAVVAIAGDVADPALNARAVAETVAAFGRLDVLVANAAIFDHNRALMEMAPEQLDAAFDQLLGVNVKGVLLAARAAVPALARTRGSIVVTASYASFHAAGGGILYTTSKHALAGVVRQLAYELAPDVRVNGVAPGVAPTRMTPAAALGGEPMDNVLPGTAEALPLGVVPAASDYAGLYVLLASRDDAAAITGTIMVADSGLGIRGIGRPAGGFATIGAQEAVATAAAHGPASTESEDR